MLGNTVEKQARERERSILPFISKQPPICPTISIRISSFGSSGGGWIAYDSVDEEK